jgi:hypothetical protein
VIVLGRADFGDDGILNANAKLFKIPSYSEIDRIEVHMYYHDMSIYEKRLTHGRPGRGAPGEG